MSESQKQRVRKLLQRRGWTLHIKRYPVRRVYIAAAKRDVNGTWHGAYIGPVARLSDLTDEEILRKIPDIA
jgi:hypothetical protein